MPRFSRHARFAAFPFLLVASAVLAGCGTQPEEPQTNEAEAPATNLPAIPRPQPPLDRAGLLGAIAQAASATAAGAEMPEEVRSLDGRQFEIRIRFGCRGPSSDLANEWLAWSYDSEARTLRVRAKPTIAKDEPLLAKLGAGKFEAVEGFWLPRPWLLQALCPAGAAMKAKPTGDTEEDEKSADKSKAGDTKPAAVRAGDPEPGLLKPSEDAGEPVPTAPRVGIAQFYTDEDARTGRRDARPYSTVKTLPEGTPISSQGFNLVLSGRLRALPDRGIIQCTASGADHPPECVVSVEFQRVRIERPDTGDLIAEWGTG